MSFRKSSILSIVSFCLVIIFQNCSSAKFSATSSNNSTQGSAGTVSTIRAIQPALAVRDSACLACHATIKANIITDFGYGSPWYIDQADTQGSANYGCYHYSADTWQSLYQVQGQVIVPDVTVPTNVVQGALASGTSAPTAPVSLVQYLTMSDIIDFSAYWVYQTWSEPMPTNWALTANVTPALSSQSSVISKPTVYIGAPTATQILALGANSSPTAPWVQVIGASTTAGLSGLNVVTGVNGTSYVTNSGPIQCSGKDVVINGTLLLNQSQFYAEKGGCRLYVTGPVFVEGAITYLNSGTAPDSSDNLQISSSTTIIMGVGFTNKSGSDTPLHRRLIADIRSNYFFRGAPTNADYLVIANAIMAEAQNIGATLLQDASFYDSSATSALSAGGESRQVINFSHLLLNAPMIHSRYLGTFSGVIVTESGLFSLGSFSFNNDSVFQNVSVLPAFKNDILCAVDAGASCNPINP